MSPFEKPQQEKPYVLVEFGEESARARPAGHDCLAGPDQLTGKLELFLITRTPVQVASGSFDVRATKQGDEIVALGASLRRYDSEGAVRSQPILPGSSLKGMMRALVEAISPSCVAVSDRDTRRALPASVERCREVRRLCPACRLFGMSGAGRENYMGQVSVTDAVVVEGGTAIVRTALLWAPARGRGGLPQRYLKGQRAAGRKFYFHSQPAPGTDTRQAIKARSVLRTTVYFENLTPGELGLLITALGLHPEHRFLPKIGGAKPVGLGSVETYITSIELHGQVVKTGRMGGKGQVLKDEEAQRQLGQWAQAAESEKLIVARALLDVVEVLQLKHLNRPAVVGMY